MAGFEVSRFGSVSGMAREWRVSKYLPLYLAGIALGAALGVGLTMQVSGGESISPPTSPPTLPMLSLAVPAAAPEVRWAEMPAINTFPDAGEIESDLPATVLLALHGYASPVAATPTVAEAQVVAPVPAPLVPLVAPAALPIAPAALPIAPAAPAVAVVPVAPVAPAAVNPVAQPEAAPIPAAPPVAAAKDNFYVPAVPGGGASNLEQRLFAGINAERASAGLPALSYDAGLTKVARTRAQQMADQGYFGHVDPNGYSMYTALLKYFGYANYAWAGENLAMNNAAAAEASERSLVSLMNSPTHRANILAGDFFRVGVGEVTTSAGRHIFAMIFLG